MTREEYMNKPTVNRCEFCRNEAFGTQASLNKLGWMCYGGEQGEYSVCPRCEKVQAEQAAIERDKEKEHQPRGFSYGT